MFQVLDYITHAEEDVVNEERQQVSIIGHVNECVTPGAYELTGGSYAPGNVSTDNLHFLGSS